MHTRFVGVLIVALFAPLCVQADTGSASSTPAPVTYNPDTRPGNPYGGQAPKPRKKHRVHSHQMTDSGSSLPGASTDTAPVVYNPDTRPGSPYVTGNDGYRKKQSRHHRKCGNCR